MKPFRNENHEINTSSMADIAFLLLIFFLVSTTILQEKGLMLKLPPKVENEPMVTIHERNLYKVLLNSKNKLLVEGEVRAKPAGLSDEIKEFILNNGSDPNSSDNPEKAIISFKTARGTDYGVFISVLDEMKKAYYEIYGSRVGLRAEEFRRLKLTDPKQAEIYKRPGREYR